MDTLRISLVQSELAWENIPANLQQFEQKLLPLAGHTDLIVLPEMFSTGFSMHPELLSTDLLESSLQWMERMAKACQAVITGSLIIREAGIYYNRLIWMQPDGIFEKYDKRHLFSYGNEQEHFARGNERLIVEYKGWRICPLICYDLRFPVWSRNTEDYHLLLYVANWPDRRIEHWKALVAARAIENQAYVAAVNRIGSDGDGVQYSGDSSLMRYDGALLWRAAHLESVSTHSISKSALLEYRNQFQFLSDRDHFQIG